MGEGKRLPSLKSSIQTILHGTAGDKAKLRRSFFLAADTPEFLKQYGLTGNYFSVRYGVITRHRGKDANHALSEQNWIDICDEITRPFAVVRYEDGFRMFVDVKVNGNLTAIGAAVKNVGKGLDVNVITTAFGHEGKVTNPGFVSVKEKLSPEQRALLDGLNYRQYLTAQRHRNR